jgi:hypothetical protein
MITSSFNSFLLKKKATQSFTLVEVIISVGVGCLMLGMVCVISAEMMKKMEVATQFRNIHENARRSLAVLTKDIRSSTNLVSYSGNNDITLKVKQSDGTIHDVHYYLSGAYLMRTDSTASHTDQLTDSVTSIDFQRWNNPGILATGASDTFEIRVYLTITNDWAFNVAGENIATDLLQARALMRNKN